MANAKPKAPADKLALYEAVVALFPDVPRKGAANPYTARNGNMFSFIDETGAVSLRMEKDVRDAFIAAHNTELSVQYGRTMKEYVVIPDAILQDLDAMQALFAASLSYVGTLKPK